MAGRSETGNVEQVVDLDRSDRGYGRAGNDINGVVQQVGADAGVDRPRQFDPADTQTAAVRVGVDTGRNGRSGVTGGVAFSNGLGIDIAAVTAEAPVAGLYLDTDGRAGEQSVGLDDGSGIDRGRRTGNELGEKGDHIDGLVLQADRGGERVDVLGSFVGREHARDAADLVVAVVRVISVAADGNGEGRIEVHGELGKQVHSGKRSRHVPVIFSVGYGVRSEVVEDLEDSLEGNVQSRRVAESESDAGLDRVRLVVPVILDRNAAVVVVADVFGVVSLEIVRDAELKGTHFDAVDDVNGVAHLLGAGEEKRISGEDGRDGREVVPVGVANIGQLAELEIESRDTQRAAGGGNVHRAFSRTDGLQA